MRFQEFDGKLKQVSIASLGCYRTGPGGTEISVTTAHYRRLNLIERAKLYQLVNTREPNGDDWTDARILIAFAMDDVGKPLFSEADLYDILQADSTGTVAFRIKLMAEQDKALYEELEAVKEEMEELKKSSEPIGTTTPQLGND